ncbi:hypothetical protein BX616_002978 [Lobosporangium transversale]|nr:hypothetical protein BX616_002978 [Lobosporangium transversale]
MSKVQFNVLSILPTTQDLLVKAKTGTGKTLAFLVAALESLMAADMEIMKRIKMSGQIGCLIVAPTRELALQISDEAQKLLEPLGYGVQHLVGGESKRKQLDRIAKEPVEFIVATPGRLNDLLDDREFADKTVACKVLVLDEADTMLELGFRTELDRILRVLPQERQTLLFSATLDSKLDPLMEIILQQKTKKQRRPIMIDTVGTSEINLNLSTRQRYCLAPYQAHVALVRRVINDYLLSDMDLRHQESLKTPTTSSMQGVKSKKASNKYTSPSTSTLLPLTSSSALSNKIMVFLPTTRGAQLYAKVFAALSMGKELSIFEIHSEKSQRERTLTSRNFKNIKTPAVLFTSDVSARGVDYPGVGLIIQVGAPLSINHYIHRIGRTGRGVKNQNEQYGEGVLILGELDQGFIEHQLKPSPLYEAVKQDHKYDDWQSVIRGENLDRGFKRAASKVGEKLIKDAYTAFLGYNLTIGPRIGNTDRKLILESADKYIAAFGVESRPAVSTSFLERMGFANSCNPVVGGSVDSSQQGRSFELVDGTFPIVNTQTVGKSCISSSTSPIDLSEDGENERNEKQKVESQSIIETRFSRKKRQEAFIDRIGLGDTEYIKINEAEWEDFIEFKPSTSRLIEKLHNPKRMGHVGNRPSKKISKIFSNNDGW